MHIEGYIAREKEVARSLLLTRECQSDEATPAIKTDSERRFGRRQVSFSDVTDFVAVVGWRAKCSTVAELDVVASLYHLVEMWHCRLFENVKLLGCYHDQRVSQQHLLQVHQRIVEPWREFFSVPTVNQRTSEKNLTFIYIVDRLRASFVKRNVVYLMETLDIPEQRRRGQLFGRWPLRRQKEM